MLDNVRLETRHPPREPTKRDPPRLNFRLRHLRYKRNEHYCNMARIPGWHGAARHRCHCANRPLDRPCWPGDLMAAIPTLSVGKLSRNTRPGRYRNRIKHRAIRYRQYSGNGWAESKGAVLFPYTTYTWILAVDQLAVCDTAVRVHKRGARCACGIVVLGC